MSECNQNQTIQNQATVLADPPVVSNQKSTEQSQQISSSDDETKVRPDFG